MDLTIRHFLQKAILGTVCAAGITVLSACHAPMTGKPLVAEYKNDDVDSQLDFWHRLGERPMTSHDDAFHGLLLYLDGNDASPDYAARVATLKSRKLLPEGFDRPAEEAIQRGTLAMVIARVVDLKGGVMYTLLGPTPRYAVRELQNEGLYPPSTPHQTFSGSEYVGIIGKLEDYQRGNAADKPASEMPAATDEKEPPSSSKEKKE